MAAKHLTIKQRAKTASWMIARIMHPTAFDEGTGPAKTIAKVV
jgi:hypothetical protein